jgi:hypothetical protein
MFQAIILPIFRSIRLCDTACGIMHPICGRPTDIHVHGGIQTHTPVGERPQTHAFDRVAAATDCMLLSYPEFSKPVWNPSRTDM